MTAAAMKYLLDANVFIEAHQRYYAFNLCPGFWKSLIWHHKQNRIYSIDRIELEFNNPADVFPYRLTDYKIFNISLIEIPPS